ncbi:MAG: L,D-transpeptidase family protein [Pseudomonadota bacterium]
MTANQNITRLGAVLTCVTLVAATIVLVATDPSTDDANSLVGVTDPLPRSSIPAPTLLPTLRLEQDMLSSRLTFMRPEIGDLEWQHPTVEVAATPESWSVEVKKLERAAPRVRSKRSKKAGRRGLTLEQRLAEISPSALGRITSKFESVGAVWPPSEIAFIAIKDQKALEVHARAKDGGWTYIHRYKVLAASGTSGPKLLRGDKQVPEGVYRISYLNPNSAYHVSLRVNYPNAFDRKMAQRDGRKDLGGDIMIHGKNVSAGCLAVGDRAAEELFVLAAEVGKRNIQVVIAPTDFRANEMVSVQNSPKWTAGLYTEIASAMSQFEAPPAPSLLTLLGL